MSSSVWLCTILLGVATSACATSPDAPLSSATWSANPQVRSARAQAGFVSYGAPYHRWTISLATIEGCTGDTIAAVELITLSTSTALPLGPTPLRADQATVASVPSAFLTLAGATGTTGTVTIDSASEGFVVGSLTAQVTLGGTPTTLTSTFSAPVCP